VLSNLAYRFNAPGAQQGAGITFNVGKLFANLPIGSMQKREHARTLSLRADQRMIIIDPISKSLADNLVISGTCGYRSSPTDRPGRRMYIKDGSNNLGSWQH
jgi:hypothetical protein